MTSKHRIVEIVTIIAVTAVIVWLARSCGDPLPAEASVREPNEADIENIRKLAYISINFADYAEGVIDANEYVRRGSSKSSKWEYIEGKQEPNEPTKKLISYEEYQKNRAEIYDIDSLRDQPCGIACPECGEEMHQDCTVMYSTYPPQEVIWCPKCTIEGKQE